jgi:1-phosphofructokinase family hexose kinase
MQRTLRFDSFTENEVNRCSEYYLHASGKGVNVARVLTQLGDRAVHLTHAGGRDRDLFLRMCADDGLEVQSEESLSEIRTCTTILNSSRGTSTELIEEARPVAAVTEEGIRRRFTALLQDVGVLILSGTKAPGYSGSLYPWMVQEASGRGITVVLDLKGDDLTRSLEFRPRVIKPNLSEFCGTFLPELSVGEHEESPGILDAVRKKARTLSREYGVCTVLTRGSRGVLAWDGEKELESPARRVTLVNTIGCGDAFTAGLAHTLALGGRLDAALEKGTDCAAANAALLKPGVIRE